MREFPGGPVVWKASLEARMIKNWLAMQRPGFLPWVGKIPWRREGFGSELPLLGLWIQPLIYKISLFKIKTCLCRKVSMIHNGVALLCEKKEQKI